MQFIQGEYIFVLLNFSTVQMNFKKKQKKEVFPLAMLCLNVFMFSRDNEFIKLCTIRLLVIFNPYLTIILESSLPRAFCHNIIDVVVLLLLNCVQYLITFELIW